MWNIRAILLIVKVRFVMLFSPLIIILSKHVSKSIGLRYIDWLEKQCQEMLKLSGEDDGSKRSKRKK